MYCMVFITQNYAKWFWPLKIPSNSSNFFRTFRTSQYAKPLNLTMAQLLMVFKTQISHPPTPALYKWYESGRIAKALLFSLLALSALSTLSPELHWLWVRKGVRMGIKEGLRENLKTKTPPPQPQLDIVCSTAAGPHHVETQSTPFVILKFSERS